MPAGKAAASRAVPARSGWASPSGRRPRSRRCCPAAAGCPACSASGRGFPYQVWAVTYPQPSSAQVVFADAGGRRLGQLSFPADYPVPAQPRTGGIPRVPLSGPHAGAVRGHDDGLPARRTGRRRRRPRGRLLGLALELGDIHRPRRRAAGRGTVRRRYHQPRQAGVFLRLRPRERAPRHAAAGEASSTARRPSPPGRAAACACGTSRCPPARCCPPASRVLLGYDAAGRVVWQKNLSAAAR